MPIQDNLHGALLISAIDFMLSFVIIGGIGLILAMFPLLNRFGKKADKNCLITSSERATGKGADTAAALPVLSPTTQMTTVPGMHPGLSDQQLVVLLTAAAYAVLGEPVRVDKFRPLTAKDLNWAAQGRSDLQSHRLK
jgi:hypothetical protein